MLVVCCFFSSLVYAQSTLPSSGPIVSWENDKHQIVFQKDLIPPLQEGLTEFYSAGSLPAIYDIFYVDPRKLTLIESADIEVYYGIARNGSPRALGINFEAMGVDEGNPQIVFPNVESNIPYETFYQGSTNADFPREGGFPMMPGDVVDLGTHQAGESLNFFLCDADGSPTNVYTGNKKLNPAKEPAMMVMAVPEAELILLGFRDPDSQESNNYFDYVFVVTVGEANAAFWLEKHAVRSPLRSILSVKDALIMSIMWCVNMVRKYGLPVLLIGLIVAGYLGWKSFVLMRIRRRKKRADEIYKQVEFNLRQQPPIQDIRLIRKGQQLDRGTKNEKRWEVLLMKTGAVSRDFSTLLDCASNAQETFEKDEAASLFTAKAAAELGRREVFENLHGIWDARSQQKSRWETLESDSYNAQHRYQEARSTLELNTAPTPPVQARLAYLKHRENPKAGWAAFQKIEHPNAEVRRFQARMLERDGKIEDAEKAYKAALKGVSSDIFLLDELAEFYRRHGRVPQALSMWSKMLVPSTPEEIWSKALFISRVTGHPLENVSADNIPLTPGQPLLLALLTLPKGTFWDEQAMSELLQKHPELGSLQVVFWLRLIDQLVRGKEGEALAQLNMARAGEFSWERALELVLLSVYGYRRAGIVPPEIMHIIESYQPEASPAQAKMLSWVQGEKADALMKRDDIFLRLFDAVGWKEVVTSLQNAGKVAQA